MSAVAETLQVDGRTRTLTVLRGPADGRIPIVLLLHGSNQNAAKLRRFTANAFDRLADDGGAVLAYLDGYKQHWNDARVSNRFAARTDGYDDVAFACAAIDLLARRYEGDESRVYVIGFSNGGQMVIRLVHEIPDLLAGAAVISAAQPVAENFAPTDLKDRPVPIMFVHGTKDPLVPYNGGMSSMWGFRPRGPGLSAPQTARYYARRNGITVEPDTEQVTKDPRGTWVEALRYRQAGHAPVTLYTVHGGGHTVPGTAKVPAVLLGRTNMDFDTVRAAADLFDLTARDDRPA
jgi:polyhydroxybutyrate depolymerase